MPAPSPKLTNRPAPPAKTSAPRPASPAPAPAALRKTPAIPPSLRPYAAGKDPAQDPKPPAAETPAATLTPPARVGAAPPSPAGAAVALAPAPPSKTGAATTPAVGTTSPATAPQPAAPPKALTPPKPPLSPPIAPTATPAAKPAAATGAQAKSASTPAAAPAAAPKPAAPTAGQRQATADTAPAAQQEGERAETAAQDATQDAAPASAAPAAESNPPAADNAAAPEAPPTAASAAQPHSAPLPGEDSNALRATSSAAGVATARGAASRNRISNADATPLQALALMQAERISSDCQHSEAAINQLAETRRRQVDAFVATLQGTISAFFARGIAQVQAFVMERQAALMAALQRTLAWITNTITGGLQSAQEWVNQARINLQTRISSLSRGLQSRVSSITGRISGLVDAVPLPDLPGVGRLRGAARSLLRGGNRLVNGALSLTTRAINGALGAGFGIISALLAGFNRVLGSALGLLSSVLSNLLQALMHAFNFCLAAIGSLLLRLLNTIVLPLFSRIGGLAQRWITRLQQRAIATLRANREQALEMLADAVVPEAGAAPPENPADTPQSQAQVLEQIRLDALQRAQLMVRLFDLLTGDGLRILLSLTRTLALTIQAAIADLIRNAAAIVTNIVTRCIEMFANVMRLVGQLVSQLGQFLRQGLSDLIDSVGRILFSPISSTLTFADTAYSRLSGAVNTLIGDFLRSVTGAAPSSSGVLGNYLPGLVGPLRGPIVKPSPGTIDWIVKVAAPLVVAAIKALVKLVGPKAALAIIIIILIVIVLLLLYLLWLLLKWLWDVITKPKKPKKPKKRVIRITPKRPELGVGGFDLATRATIAPGRPLFPALTWTVNPGGTPPAGVSVVGSGRRVKLRSAHPAHATTLGGTAFTVRAALTSNSADFADSAPITLIQILTANYTAVPALANVPSLIPGTFPPNTGEPNRDGISGNTVNVNTTSAPTPRTMQLGFRTSLGASASAMTVRPGSKTGDIGLRITDKVTGAELDPTRPATAGGAAMMSELTVNAVPTRVASLTNAGNLGPYGVLNTIGFTASDTLHPPLTRIVGELITNGGDQFNIPPPNANVGGFNNAFDLRLAVPANQWNDQLVTNPAAPNVVDGRPAIDVNRFVGPGVPQLPRALIYRQRFQYSSWQGAGTVISRTFADGKHIRSLIGAPPTFQFRTEHVFGSVAANPRIEPYVGNPLIDLSNMTLTPNAPGATALAADGAATAEAGVTSSVAGRIINWSARSGGMSFIAGNPATLPATATLQAGRRAGNFTLRAADSIFANRRLDGQVTVARVALNNMQAAQPEVPPGTLSTTVSLNAEPGGRTVDWTLDAAALAAGVTVNPATVAPGPAAMTVTVTRPAAFSGRVKVIATDRVTGRSNSMRIRFN